MVHNLTHVTLLSARTKKLRKEMKGMWTVGNGWCPFFGSMIFLAQSLSMQNYSIVFRNEKENKNIANNFLNIVMGICEGDLLTSDDLIFNKWIAQKSS